MMHIWETFPHNPPSDDYIHGANFSNLGELAEWEEFLVRMDLKIPRIYCETHRCCF